FHAASGASAHSSESWSSHPLVRNSSEGSGSGKAKFDSSVEEKADARSASPGARQTLGRDRRFFTDRTPRANLLAHSGESSLRALVENTAAPSAKVRTPPSRTDGQRRSFPSVP